MKAYKFRSLQNFEHVADIFFKKRFHASQYSKLNDPMEAFFKNEVETKQANLDELKKR